jgi:hypothetical protein
MFSESSIGKEPMGITGRKIDLAKIEPRRFGTSEQKAALESKDYFKQLTKLTAEVAQEQNQIIEQEYGIKNVIMENGSLSMDAFTEDQKGPYPKFNKLMLNYLERRIVLIGMKSSLMM